MKLSALWEVWTYILLVIIYIIARLRETEFYNSDGFLGSNASDLAHVRVMEHPVQQQEGYRQLPCFKINGDNVHEFMQGFPEVCNFWNIHNMVYQDVAKFKTLKRHGDT